MDFDEMLAPAPNETLEKVKNSALAFEAKVVRLPRVYKEVESNNLGTTAAKSLLNFALALYGLITKKSLDFRVKDRRLNKFGRIGTIIALISSVTMLLLSLHEVWARVRLKPMNDKERVEQMVMEMEKLIRSKVSLSKPWTDYPSSRFPGFDRSRATDSFSNFSQEETSGD